MISPGTLVNEIGTGRQGLVCETDPTYCTADDGDEPLPQVFFFDGKSQARVTEVPERQLRVIGPENALADPELCRAGGKFCVFLISVEGKPRCGRTSKLRLKLIRDSADRYLANRKFPDCRQGSARPAGT